MKKRNGFVSNSSSSSFIVSYLHEPKCECCNRDYLTMDNIIDLIYLSNSDNTDYKGGGYKKVKEHLKDFYYCRSSQQ